ncbi:MAG: VUT family protein, partial [Candidatus Aenigmatarchaeota archaeon]
MPKISTEKKLRVLYPGILFGILLMLSNVTASKIIQWRFIIVPVAVLAYPFTFAMTDVISEIWGKKTAGRVVKAGFIGQLIALLLIQIMLKLKPAPFCRIDPEFQALLGSSSRIIIAS